MEGDIAKLRADLEREFQPKVKEISETVYKAGFADGKLTVGGELKAYRAVAPTPEAAAEFARKANEDRVPRAEYTTAETRAKSAEADRDAARKDRASYVSRAESAERDSAAKQKRIEELERQNQAEAAETRQKLASYTAEAGKRIANLQKELAEAREAQPTQYPTGAGPEDEEDEDLTLIIEDETSNILTVGGVPADAGYRPPSAGGSTAELQAAQTMLSEGFDEQEGSAEENGEQSVINIGDIMRPEKEEPEIKDDPRTRLLRYGLTEQQVNGILENYSALIDEALQQADKAVDGKASLLTYFMLSRETSRQPAPQPEAKEMIEEPETRDDETRRQLILGVYTSVFDETIDGKAVKLTEEEKQRGREQYEGLIAAEERKSKGYKPPREDLVAMGDFVYNSLLSSRKPPLPAAPAPTGPTGTDRTLIGDARKALAEAKEAQQAPSKSRVPEVPPTEMLIRKEAVTRFSDEQLGDLYRGSLTDPQRRELTLADKKTSLNQGAEALKAFITERGQVTSREAQDFAQDFYRIVRAEQKEAAKNKKPIDTKALIRRAFQKYVKPERLEGLMKDHGYAIMSGATVKLEKGVGKGELTDQEAYDSAVKPIIKDLTGEKSGEFTVPAGLLAPPKQEAGTVEPKQQEQPKPAQPEPAKPTQERPPAPQKPEAVPEPAKPAAAPKSEPQPPAQPVRGPPKPEPEAGPIREVRDFEVRMPERSSAQKETKDKGWLSTTISGAVAWAVGGTPPEQEGGNEVIKDDKESDRIPIPGEGKTGKQKRGSVRPPGRPDLPLTDIDLDQPMKEEDYQR